MHGPGRTRISPSTRGTVLVSPGGLAKSEAGRIALESVSEAGPAAEVVGGFEGGTGTVAKGESSPSQGARSREDDHLGPKKLSEMAGIELKDPDSGGTD